MTITKQLNIEVRDEDIKEAFLQSAIHAQVTEVLQKMLTDAWNDYHVKSAIRETVTEYFKEAISALIEAKYKPMIEEYTRKVMTEQIIADSCRAIAERFVKNLGTDRDY